MNLDNQSNYSPETDGTPEHRLPLFRGCVDTLYAALWLIAGENYPQALSLFHSSIELAFKAELARIHPLLIAAKLDFDTLKSFLKDDFLKHPQGSQLSIKDFDQLSISDFDLDKTISFIDALARMKDIYPELFQRWGGKIAELHKHRNKIIHYGAISEDDGEYACAIALIALPFLDEFLTLSNQWPLGQILREEMYREIAIARQVTERLVKEKLPLRTYVLRAVRCKVLQSHSTLPEPESEEGYQSVFEKDFVLSQEAEERINRKWFDNFYLEISCRICDSARTFVKVQPIKEPVLDLIPLAVYCPKCGLEINEEDKYLALYHVGKIEKELVDKFFEENRDALEYDGFFRTQNDTM
jgi:hypothetical protein